MLQRVTLTDGSAELLIRPRSDVALQELDVGFPEVREVTEPRTDTDGERDTTARHGASTASLTLRVTQQTRAFLDELAAFCRPATRPYLVVEDDEWAGPRRLRLRAEQLTRPIATGRGLTREVQAQWKVPDGVWESVDSTVRTAGASVPSTTGLIVTAADGVTISSDSSSNIAFVAAQASQTDPSAPSTTLDVPAGVADGQLMIAVLKRINDGAPTAVPAGWTLIGESATGAGWMGTYWRIASAEPASYTWQFDLYARARGDILLYTGHNPVNPIAASVESVNGTNLVTYESDPLTIADDDAWLVASIGARVAAPATQSWTVDDANDAERSDLTNGNLSGYAATMATYDSARGLSPETYDRTFTAAQECTHAQMHLIAIRKAIVQEGGLLITASSDAGAAVVTLAAGVDLHWVARLYGPATAPRFTLDSTGETLEFTAVDDLGEKLTIAAGDYLEINSRDRTAYYLSQTGASRLSYLNFTTSTWWQLRAGEDNQVRYHPESGTDGRSKAVLTWRDNWL